MVVLDANTGIVSATEREVALSLDLVQKQALGIQVEGVIGTSLLVRFSAQYDNRLIVQSGDKWPCSRCKVEVEVVRVDFLPHLLALCVDVNLQALDGLDRDTTCTDAANSIDSLVNVDARRTTPGNVEHRNIISPLVSIDVIPVTSLLVVTVSISADQENMSLSLVLHSWALRAPDRNCITIQAFSIILAKAEGRVASSKAGIASDGLWGELALIKLCQFDAHSIFFLNQNHSI